MAQHHHPKFLQTVIVMIIVNTLEHQLVTAEDDCRFKTYRGLWLANCIYAGLKRIPNNIDTNIEGLDVSGNPIAEIRRSDMMKYKNLKQFTYEGSGPLSIEFNAFVDLHELTWLLLSGTKIVQTGFIIFPTKIESFLVSNASMVSEFLDISKLENLKLLDIKENHLTTFPKIHKYAPIERINVIRNPLKSIYLAPFIRYCKLKQIIVGNEQIENSARIAKDKCECPRWKEWLRRKKIQSTGEFRFLPCQPKDCREELIPKKWEQLYDDCVNNIRDPSHELDASPAPAPAPAPPPPPPPPSNPNSAPDTPPNQPSVQVNQEPMNVPSASGKKPLSKLLYLLMSLLVFVTVLSAMCFYIIRGKRRSSRSLDEEDEDPDDEDDDDNVDNDDE